MTRLNSSAHVRRPQAPQWRAPAPSREDRYRWQCCQTARHTALRRQAEGHTGIRGTTDEMGCFPSSSSSSLTSCHKVVPVTPPGAASSTQGGR